jgi:hypothetical protein
MPLPTLPGREGFDYLKVNLGGIIRNFQEEKSLAPSNPPREGWKGLLLYL